MDVLQARRQRFIAEQLERHAKVRARDICEAFDVSAATAQRDINRYVMDFPGTLRFDKARRQYVLRDRRGEGE